LQPETITTLAVKDASRLKAKQFFYFPDAGAFKIWTKKLKI
jgi:hypothetical protein